MSRLASAGLLALIACSTSPVMRAAEQGDLAAMRSLIEDGERRATLTKAEAARLAHVVADRDLRAAVGPEAVERLRAAASCARELDDALAARMTTHDDAGAQAALERLDAGALGSGDVRGFVGASDAAWRAVGARALVDEEDHTQRLAALIDPDPRVRRQAARAATIAKDARDVASLLEAARLDPEPMVRSEAVRALRALGAAAGPGLASALADLWPHADDGLREDIAVTWASPEVWDAGGREALRTLVSSAHGAGVVEGAFALLRRGPRDPEVERASLEQVARAVASGSRARRLQAIAGAPLDRPELLLAVKQAASDADLEVRVGALARLVEAKEPDAGGALVRLAAPGSSVAQRARFALAVLEDRRTQAWVEADLSATDASQRLGAVTSLAAMGAPARAAPVLADSDPTTRVRAACSILLAARRR